MAKFTGKKHFTYTGGLSYETREEAETAAKKHMETHARHYGANSDITIYEAVATVRFPTPAYEVVDIAKA